jgi:hypothetical protein
MKNNNKYYVRDRALKPSAPSSFEKKQQLTSADRCIVCSRVAEQSDADNVVAATMQEVWEDSALATANTQKVGRFSDGDRVAG